MDEEKVNKGKRREYAERFSSLFSLDEGEECLRKVHAFNNLVFLSQIFKGKK